MSRVWVSNLFVSQFPKVEGRCRNFPWAARRSSPFQLLHVAVSRPCHLSKFTPNRASLIVLLSYKIITNSGTGTIRFQRELWSVDFGDDNCRLHIGAPEFFPTNYEECLHWSEWVSEWVSEWQFAYRSPHKNSQIRFAYPRVKNEPCVSSDIQTRHGAWFPLFFLVHF